MADKQQLWDNLIGAVQALCAHIDAEESTTDGLFLVANLQLPGKEHPTAFFSVTGEDLAAKAANVAGAMLVSEHVNDVVHLAARAAARQREKQIGGN